MDNNQPPRSPGGFPDHACPGFKSAATNVPPATQPTVTESPETGGFQVQVPADQQPAPAPVQVDPQSAQPTTPEVKPVE